MEVDLARLGYDDPRLSDLEWHLVQAAQQHNANTLYLLQTVPGIGTLLSLVLLEALHDLQRCPRGPDGVSSCRLVTCAKDAAGTRDGTAGTKSGHASLPGAFSEAAGLCLRDNVAGPTDLTGLAKQHGQGQALTRLAQKLGRAVDDLGKRQPAFELPTVLRQSCAARVRLTPHWTCRGGAGAFWGRFLKR